LIICTEWQVFRKADPQAIKSRLKNPVVFDGRNIFKPEAMRDLGFTYFFVG